MKGMIPAANLTACWRTATPLSISTAYTLFNPVQSVLTIARVVSHRPERGRGLNHLTPGRRWKTSTVHNCRNSNHSLQCNMVVIIWKKDTTLTDLYTFVLCITMLLSGTVLPRMLGCIYSLGLFGSPKLCLKVAGNEPTSLLPILFVMNVLELCKTQCLGLASQIICHSWIWSRYAELFCLSALNLIYKKASV